MSSGCHHEIPRVGGSSAIGKSQTRHQHVQALLRIPSFAILFLCPHMAERSSLCVSSYKGTDLTMRALPLGPNHLPEAPPPNAIPLGVRPSTYGLGLTQIFSP